METGMRSQADTIAHSVFEDIEEYTATPTWIEGELPAGLEGTLYYNGPGRSSLSTHLFDGDGAIRALWLGRDQSPVYRQFFVKTDSYKKETAKNKTLFRGYGTQIPGGVLANICRRLKNCANTSVMLLPHERNDSVDEDTPRLLALYEGGHPYLLNETTLETVGEYNFKGSLPNRLPFSAHPHIDPYSGKRFSFGVSMGRTITLTIFCISNFDGRISIVAEVPLPKFYLIHDFAITARYFVFLAGPVALPRIPLKFILGLESLAETIERQVPESTLVVLVPRSGDPPRFLETDPTFFYHFAGAHDDTDSIVVDLVSYGGKINLQQNVESYAESKPFTGSYGKLERYRISTWCPRLVKERNFTKGPTEFPTFPELIPSKERRYTYVAMNDSSTDLSWLHGIARVDRHLATTDFFDFGKRTVAGEPVFAFSPLGSREDDAWILSLVYDCETHTSFVAIFDAYDIAKGPITKIHLPYSAGMPFHGLWVDSVLTN